jgi:hypothetical protein
MNFEAECNFTTQPACEACNETAGQCRWRGLACVLVARAPPRHTRVGCPPSLATMFAVPSWMSDDK